MFQDFGFVVFSFVENGDFNSFLGFAGPSALPSSNKEKLEVLRKRRAPPLDPSAFIPAAGVDSFKRVESSDTNPLISPKLRSIFKKKKVVEVTLKSQGAPSLGKWIFFSSRSFSAF